MVLAMSDGIQGREFVLDASWQDRTGDLYFGGSNGVTAFLPGEVRPSVREPEFREVRYLVNGREVLGTALKNLTYQERITSRSNWLTVTFRIPAGIGTSTD